MYYISAEDGIKLAVYDLNPNGCKTIFFIHGWPLSHKIFEYQTNHLVKRGYRVVSMDLRGFGKSDTAAFDYSYNRLAKDVYQVVRELKLRNFTLAGFSVGGAIALRYMKCFKGYGVKRLALLSAAAPRFTCGTDYPYGMSRDAADALIAQAYTDRPQMDVNFGRMLFASHHSQNLKDWFNDISFEASGIGTIAVLESLRDEDVSKDLAAVHVPTGIFHGKLDQVCPFAFALLIRQAIPHALLYAFENSGHAVFYDELETFNATFFNWLE